MRRAKLSPPASCIDDVLPLLPILSLLEDAADKDVTGRVVSDGVGNGGRLGDDVGLLPVVPLAPLFLQWLPLHFDCADDDGSWVIGEKARHDDAPTPMAHATVRDRFMALLGRGKKRIEVRYQYDQRSSRALMCWSNVELVDEVVGDVGGRRCGDVRTLRYVRTMRYLCPTSNIPPPSTGNSTIQ